ncbi:MAG: hypothetical protein ACFBSG_20530 [Leptolyngbyaceae cyanobacterium]
MLETAELTRLKITVLLTAARIRGMSTEGLPVPGERLPDSMEVGRTDGASGGRHQGRRNATHSLLGRSRSHRHTCGSLFSAVGTEAR